MELLRYEYDTNKPPVLVLVAILKSKCVDFWVVSCRTFGALSLAGRLVAGAHRMCYDGNLGKFLRCKPPT